MAASLAATRGEVACRPLSVGAILADNFTLSAFSLFIDPFRLAADESDRSRPIRCRWAIMSSQSEPIRASCGIKVQPTSGFLDPVSLDYIAVVGGLLRGPRQIDTGTEAYLRQAAAQGTTLIGICTGSFVLCRAGLMAGRRSCVSWLHYQDFREAFPDHEVTADRLFEIDADRITCAGGGGAADLAHHLIERHLGAAVAQKCRQVMLLERTRGGTEPQPHPPIVESVKDQRVCRALLLMEQNLADPMPIADIASRLDLSTRQIERLFRAALGERPAALYRRLRLRYARWLLDNTDRSVTEIALDAGFSDSAHFSREFKRVHGLSPSSNRTRSHSSGLAAGGRVFD